MKVGLWIAAIALTLSTGTGLYLLWKSASAMRLAISAEHWPTAVAELEGVTLNTHADSEGTSTYEVKVAYRYQVAGADYPGNTVNFGYGPSTGHAQHAKLLDKLRTAKTVEVHYNPARPEQSSIGFGPTRSHFINLSLALTFVLVSLGFAATIAAFQSSDERLLARIKIIQPAAQTPSPSPEQTR